LDYWAAEGGGDKEKMPSAYYVPTPEASLTAVAARALQGCADGCSMGWYMPGTQSPALLSGLGVGAGSGRFNRALARGVYQLPFVQASTPGSYGLGQVETDATTLIVGGILLAAAAFIFGGRTIPRAQRRVRRVRRRLRKFREGFRL
jgi:hypothetical protein